MGRRGTTDWGYLFLKDPRTEMSFFKPDDGKRTSSRIIVLERLKKVPKTTIPFPFRQG
jgi:hypothetical protein